MKRLRLFILFLILPLLLLLSLCACSGSHNAETTAPAEQTESIGDTQVGLEKQYTTSPLPQDYRLQSGQIYHEDGSFCYFDKAGQLVRVPTPQFTATVISDEESISVAFTWAVCNGKLYTSNDTSMEYWLDPIAGNTTHVILGIGNQVSSKQYYVCNLLDGTVVPCFSDITQIEQLELSADMETAVYTTQKSTKAFYHDGTKTIDLPAVCGVDSADTVGATLIDGGALLFCIEKTDDLAPKTSVYRYDAGTGTVQKTIDQMPRYVQIYQEQGFSPHGKKFGTYDNNGFLTLLSPQTGEEKTTDIAYADIYLKFSNSEWLCVALNDGTLVILSLDTGSELLRAETDLDFMQGQEIIASEADFYFAFTDSSNQTQICRFPRQK